MIKENQKLFNAINIVSDALMAVFAMIVSYLLVFHLLDFEENYALQDYIKLALLYIPIQLMTFGCMGLGDCVKVCPEGAICIRNGIAHIDTRKCIGCGLCVRTCPRGIIELMADKEKVLLTCNNKEKGAVVRKKCTNGCIGCKMCEKNCPSGAIKVENNLARIDYSLCTNCGECAKNCPVGCIFVSDFRGLHNSDENVHVKNQSE